MFPFCKAKLHLTWTFYTESVFTQYCGWIFWTPHVCGHVSWFVVCRSSDLFLSILNGCGVQALNYLQKSLITYTFILFFLQLESYAPSTYCSVPLMSVVWQCCLLGPYSLTWDSLEHLDRLWYLIVLLLKWWHTAVSLNIEADWLPVLLCIWELCCSDIGCGSSTAPAGKCMDDSTLN